MADDQTAQSPLSGADLPAADLPATDLPAADPPGADPSAPRCPWCSAVLPSADVTECPSCLATLVSTADAAVPGVTAIDVEAMLRGRREPARQRGGILGWISGEAGDETPTPAELRSVEAPTADVRREMLRLEIEAERQRLEAEAAALALEDQLANEKPVSATGDEDAPQSDADAESSAAVEQSLDDGADGVEANEDEATA
jgi:hypothetical protein